MTPPIPACVQTYRAIASGRAAVARHPRIGGLLVVEIAGDELPRAIVDLTHGGDLSTLPALCAAAIADHEAEHAKIWGKQSPVRPQLEMEV